MLLLDLMQDTDAAGGIARATGYAARDEVVNDGQVVPVKLTTIVPVNDQSEITALKAALAEAEARATLAEALAIERATGIEDLRRMLPAPNTKPKRGWWPW